MLQRCVDFRGFWQIVAALALLGANGCAQARNDLGDQISDPGLDLGCSAGARFTCDGAAAVSCSAPGQRIDCAAAGQLCHHGLGCVTCTPGEGTCSDGNATVCRPDGSGYATHHCDPVQGMTCEPNGCKGPCSWGALGDGYVGCDYHPTVTLNNGIWGGFQFAVVVGNLGTQPANVVVTRGLDQIDKTLVAPGALEVIRLPWVAELRGPEPSLMGQPQHVGPSKLVEAGAYRVRSDQPITAYQFNPLDYRLDPKPADCPDPAEAGGCFSYSNDASLLLPAHVLRQKYVAMAWPDVGCKPGFFSVTAIEDGTEVTIRPLGKIEPGGGFDSSGQGYAILSAGSVLQVHGAPAGGPFCFNWPGSDLSGTLIESTKPVQVISGHACANVPAPETQACDHIEETMFPLETLGREYLVSVPAPPGGAQSGDSSHTLRISSVREKTLVSFDPPIADPVELAPEDPPLELRYVRKHVKISAGAPLLVASYLHGTDANADPSVSGDPGQSLAVPVEQFRKQYVFLAPENYSKSFVDVTAPIGSQVTLDGSPIAADAFSPIGESGWAVARVELAATGVHSAASDKSFGISVYGYGDWTSYIYPGGLNLGAIDYAPH
jgi:hypothetical protein